MKKIAQLYVVPRDCHWEMIIYLPCEMEKDRKVMHYVGKDKQGNRYLKCMRCSKVWLVKPDDQV